MCDLDKLYSKWKHNPFILYMKRERVIEIDFMVFHGVQNRKINMHIHKDN